MYMVHPSDTLPQALGLQKLPASRTSQLGNPDPIAKARPHCAYHVASRTHRPARFVPKEQK